jgi:probable phosphoglycerate mutase
VTTFYLIRHGANDLVGKAVAGWTPGVHLNLEGQRQAADLAAAIGNVPFDRLYSSPLERARETAEPLAQRLRLPVLIADAIGELRFGQWTGKLLHDLAQDARWNRWNTFRSGARIPDGETMLEAQGRLVGFIEHVAAESPGQTIAVFSHGDPLRTVLLYYLGMPIDFFHRLEISPASVCVLQLSPGGAQFLCINQTFGRPFPAA